NVSGMMIANQDRPLILWLPVPFRPPRPTHGDFRAVLGSSEGIRSGIRRVTQNRQNRVVKRRLPEDSLVLLVIANRRQRNAFFAKPQQCLASASALVEFLQHQTNRVLYTNI